MGVLIVTKKEIADAIMDGLDGLEGKLYKKDFHEAAKQVENKYKDFSKED